MKWTDTGFLYLNLVSEDDDTYQLFRDGDHLPHVVEFDADFYLGPACVCNADEAMVCYQNIL